MPHGDCLESPPLGFEASPQRSAACSGAKAYTKGGKKGGGRKEAISEGSEEKIISEDAPMLSRSRKKTTDSSERSGTGQAPEAISTLPSRTLRPGPGLPPLLLEDVLPKHPSRLQALQLLGAPSGVPSQPRGHNQVW